MNYLFKRPNAKSSCILEILSSKRLLVDHLEVAELCFRLAPSIVAKRRTLPLEAVGAGCLFALAAASIRVAPSFVGKSWQLVASSSGTLLLGAWLYEKLFHWRDHRTIARLIGSIEHYDTAAKRLLIFINEVIYGNERINAVRRSANENELVEACIESCTKAIYDLYDYAKVLEERTVLREEYGEAYDPLESFENCEIFKQTSATHSKAKQLYNIFLYMQSHCLLRLVLAIASDTTIADVRLESNRLTACLTCLAQDLSKQLKINSVSQADCLRQLCQVKEPTSKELSLVKHQSLELTVKLAANVNHMLALDKAMQSIASTQSTYDRQQLEEAAAQLATIQSYLLTRTDECERLLITVKKLLNLTPGDEPTDATEAELDVPPDTLGEPLAEPQNKALEWQDEFFVTDIGAEGEDDSSDPTATLQQLQAEDELVAKRLMRKQFQPILRQLRERLVPVEQSFRERERAAMKRKGILLPEEMEEEQTINRKVAAIETDDDESDSDGSQASLRCKRSQTRYDEHREFLASKPQFSLLAALPRTVQMEESILE
uniref:Vezatin n=1 Tax=Anopheles epiroticus TaxID=199890 RepID=A0A182P6U8_9DIPT